MTDARLFDFEALFVESAPDPHPRSTKANRYEFGIAYADPESVPLDGLLEAIGRGLKEDGRDLAKYPHPQGYPSLRELIAEKVAKTTRFATSLLNSLTSLSNDKLRQILNRINIMMGWG